MAKGTYIGVSGATRKVKKGYLGIDGVARKIKKAYIGVGGVARPCWTGGEPAYYGTATDLTTAVYSASGANVGNYALIAGGNPYGSNSVSTVNVYDSSLVKQSDLTAFGAGGISSASTGTHAVFAGGYSYGVGRVSNAVAFDASLTKTTLTSLSAARYDMGGGAIGGYAVFAGGRTAGAVSTVEVYNASLTKTTATALSETAYKACGANTKNHLLIHGRSTCVDAYDASLTKTQVSTSCTVYEGTGTKSGESAIFAGETSPKDSTPKAEAFSETLTQTVIVAPSVYNASIGKGDFSFFAGSEGGSTALEVYELITKVLSPTITLSCSYSTPATAQAGDYLLFAGGAATQTDGGTVDVLKVG